MWVVRFKEIFFGLEVGVDVFLEIVFVVFVDEVVL